MAEDCKNLAQKPEHCPVFGLPTRMSLNMLPTVEGVLIRSANGLDWIYVGPTQPRK